MAQRLVSVDEKYMFPTPLEARLGTKIDAAKTAAISDATTKYGELPSRVTSLKEGVELATGRHLDEYREPARHYQQTNANARTDLGYPIEKAGVLEISKWGPSGASGANLMEQYWPYNHEGFFFRHVYYDSKAWKEIPSKAAVSNMIAAALPPIVPPRSSRTSVAAIGDSLTDGYSAGNYWAAADKWPTILDGLLPGASVLEYGMSGYTTDATMLYVGAHRPRFTIPGGAIPANGTAVTVTTPERFGLQPGSVAIGGTLGGVNGTLAWASATGWKFNSLGGASGTGLVGPQEFIATRTGTWEGGTVIIWLGRNDISNATTGAELTVPDHVVASTKRLVDQLTPRVKSIMICGVTTRTSEVAGSREHGWVTEINDRLRSIYPEYFHGAQAYLRDRAMVDLGLTPTADDTAKLSAGTIPPSLMDDETHISKATAAIMARKFFQPFLTAKGFVD